MFSRRPGLLHFLPALLVAACGGPSRGISRDLATPHQAEAPAASSARPDAGAVAVGSVRPPPGTTASIAGIVARAPRVAAARLRRDAAKAAATAAGVLPDPMLDAGVMYMPDENDRGAMIELGQTLPRWGERDAMRAMASAELAMAEADLAMARGETLARLAMLHAQARAALAKETAYAANARRAEALADLVARSAVATSGGRLAEVLTLRSRAASREIDALQARTAAADAFGRARALLAMAPEQMPPDPGLTAASQALPANDPRLRFARASQARARAERALASSRSHPEIGVRAGWWREGREEPDEYRLGVVVALPLRPAAWRGPELAARRREAAADLDATAALADADELVARSARAAEQARRATVVATATAQRLDVELDSLAAGVATGDGGATAMLFERLDMLAETQVMAVMAEADAAMAAADLWMLVVIPDPVPERP